MKTYKSVTEQIALLKSRKMIFTDESLARRILTYEGYYCVINGYKAPFINSTIPNDSYKTGTNFNEIHALYTFDRKLREILMPDLLRIEHSVKTKIVDIFSQAHGHAHTSYLRPESFNTKGFENFKRTNALIFNILKLIDKQRNVHPSIQHYMNKYGYVPLWVLAGVITFGKLNSFYGCMLVEDKEKVSNAFGLDSANFKALIDYIAVFRNKCAHSDRIYCRSKDQKKPRPIPNLSLHDKLNIPKNQKGFKYGKQDILALLISMKYFLQNDRFRRLIKRTNYALDTKLSKALKTISHEDIGNIMGLIGDWTKLSVISLNNGN